MAPPLPDVRFQELWKIKLDPETDEKRKRLLAYEDPHDFFIDLLAMLAEISVAADPVAVRSADSAHVKELVGMLTSIFSNKPPSAACTDPGPYSSAAGFARMMRGATENEERIVRLFQTWDSNKSLNAIYEF
ncbi:hypothetical protein PSEUBRA_002873 [Kalmanozyma brasiliensis GHG001]|uniref:uncharacterized protein n=1 Tax=Kalmanozyma brasiliensis (strain GHG001) TaxID=1365824 RepID=UPI002867EB68|nr:uncharacterized protein PSEUBRA_002873 [Kalmanozyma brasiliensis GHG001]KAF6767143.1 hypothetical protein PSEUBRA_002873 [Kalmanozyma brasiliensis GHG001]